MIREIGRHSGEGPSAVIARAVKELKEKHRSISPEDAKRRFGELMKVTPPRDPNLTWKDIEDEMNSIFD
jgi:hypothetical protein